MQTFLVNIQQFLGRLSLGQKVALGVMVLGTLGILGGISYWAGQPDYALLFGGMEPSDASSVVESLKTNGVKYELRENGTAIYVPRQEVYELRLQFAGEGIVSQGPTGYELFDEGTLGMTDFMQKLNMKRALEGELARTIASIRQVEACRVHLVIPERSAFRQAQAQPSASVALQLTGSTQLTAAQIKGITELVAGAVEGLAPTAVTVLDAQGNMLSDPDAGNADLTIGTTQLKMQQAIEARLTEKGQSMLDQVLGHGNAIVRVAASLDFSTAISERNVIDPESATVISEERLEEGGDETTLSANSSVRNYELSRTLERSEKGLGDIKDLSVSVILNYKTVVVAPPDSVEDAEPEELEEPYLDEEVREIEALVKNAVGFQEQRGDRFAIHQTRFDTSIDTQLTTELQRQRDQEQLHLYIRYGLMVLALVLATLLIRSASRRLQVDEEESEQAALEGSALNENLLSEASDETDLLSEGHTTAGLLAPPEDEINVDDFYASKLTDEAKARLKAKHLMYDEIKKQVTDRPETTAEVLRSWLAEDVQHGLNM